MSLSTAYATLGIFHVSPPTPAVINFDTPVDNAVASTIGSDDTADSTVGIVPMSPITTTVSPAPPAVADVDVDIAASDNDIAVVVLILHVVSVRFLVVALTIFDVVIVFAVVGRFRVTVNPIVTVAAVIRVLVFVVVVEASVGLFPAFRSLRLPCDDN